MVKDVWRLCEELALDSGPDKRQVALIFIKGVA
jgi:hypothetical protein